MQIIDLVQGKYNIISVIGMSKNAGKTVALNELLCEAAGKDMVIGLTSIGRDGEKQDIVTCTEKPLIYVMEGTYIATAESLFNCSEAKLEILEITDFRTPIGRIIIAKAISPGYVQIAGPCSNSEIRVVAEKMLEYGAELSIVDGALDRVSSASPTITQATILATGAVLSRDMNKVVEQTVHRVNLFHIEEERDDRIKAIAKTAFEEKKVTLIDEAFTPKTLSIKTSLNAGKTIGEAIEASTHTVIIPGSFVTKTAMDITSMTKHYRNVNFVIQDATKVFIDHRDWLLLNKLGLNLKVMESINILAVTINPYAPQGYYFDPTLFKERMGTYLNNVPVIDVMEGCEF
ncbi:MAG: hypothetical protein JXO44_14495 [Clostridia bacterium]|nr:hypothetical protein [Clostridia bacterium]